MSRTLSNLGTNTFPCCQVLPGAVLVPHQVLLWGTQQRKTESSTGFCRGYLAQTPGFACKNLNFQTGEVSSFRGSTSWQDSDK